MTKLRILTDVDQLRLRELLEHMAACGDTDRQYMELLSQRIRESSIVEQRRVPRDVVTMNSLVGLRDLDAQENWSCTLAYPHDADLVDRKVSVAVPLGATLLGQQAGDVVECPVPDGTRRLRIERVYYQPEAAGDYHL